MFFRMVWRSLAQARAKRAMIAATTALGACVATAMLSVVFDVGDKVNAELGTYGANIVVQARGAGVLDEIYQMESDLPKQGLAEEDLPKIKTIFWAFNIVDFAPFLTTPAHLGDNQDVDVVGTWFSHHLDLPSGEHAVAGIANLRSFWNVDGGWIADGDTDLAMVGERVARSQGLELGDQLALAGQDAQAEVLVAGIIHSGGEEDNQVIVPLATAQKLAGRPGQVDTVEVAALTTPDNDLSRKAARNPKSLTITEWETWYCTAYVSSIAYQIEEALPDAVAKPQRQVTESSGNVLAKTRTIMLLVAGLALFASGLAIANLVTASVIERSKQIGLLKAIGASDGAVIRLVLTEMTVIGLLGGAVGYGAGLAFAQVIGRTVFDSSINARPVVAALVAIGVIGVVIGGCIGAIRYLTRLRPAEVLHGR